MLESNNNKKRKRICEGLQAEQSGLKQRVCRSDVHYFFISAVIPSISFFFHIESARSRIGVRDVYSSRPQPRKRDREVVLSKLIALPRARTRAFQSGRLNRPHSRCFSFFSLSLSLFSPIGCRERG